MTCHRRESVHVKDSLHNIVELMGKTDRKIYFPASYRTQKQLKEYGFSLPSNVVMTDPIGYKEMLTLVTNARGVLTDSGTLVEETAVLGVPSLQIRKATERPQVYDCHSSVKFDPARPDKYPYDNVLHKLENLWGTTWEHGLGDGHASERIVNDLVERYFNNNFDGPEKYAINTARSFQEDMLDPVQ